MKTFPLLGVNLRKELIEPNKVPEDLDWLGKYDLIWNVFKTKTNDYLILHRGDFTTPSQVEIPLTAAPWVAARIKALLLPPEEGGEPLNVFSSMQTFNEERIVVFRGTVFGKRPGFTLQNKNRIDHTEDTPPQYIQFPDEMILKDNCAFLKTLASMEQYV